jgi:hypothetical protein
VSLIHIESMGPYPDNFDLMPTSGAVRKITDGNGYAYDSTSTRWGYGKRLKCTFSPSSDLGLVPNGGGPAYNLGSPGSDDVLVGFAFRMDTEINRVPVCGLFDAFGNCLLSISTTELGYLIAYGPYQVGSGSTSSPVTLGIGTSFPMAKDTWYWVEAQLGEDICKVWINGQLVIDFSGSFSPVTGWAGYSWLPTDLCLGGSGNGAQGQIRDRGKRSYQDLYIAIKDGSGVTDRLGDSRVAIIWPTSIDANTGYASTGGSTVADRLGSASFDGDTTYYEADDLNDNLSLSSTDSVPSTPIVVHGVEVTSISRKTAAGDRSTKAVVKISSTTYLADIENVMTEAYSVNRGIFEEDPSTTAAWTKSGVEAASFGEKITA